MFRVCIQAGESHCLKLRASLLELLATHVARVGFSWHVCFLLTRRKLYGRGLILNRVLYQYLSNKDHNLGKAAIPSIWVIVLRSFESESAHFLLNDTRIAAESTDWKSYNGDVV
jgi:hypothetical protein